MSNLPPSPELTSGNGISPQEESVPQQEYSITPQEELPLPADLQELPEDAPIRRIAGAIRDEFTLFWDDVSGDNVENGSMVVGNKQEMTKKEQAKYDALGPKEQRLVLDKGDRQEAFERDIRWAQFMLTNLTAIVQERPGAIVRVRYDVDEVIAKQKDQSTGRWLVGAVDMEGVNYKKPETDEEEARLHEITRREQGKRLQLRPALGPVSNYLYQNLGVTSELLSSHRQAEMTEDIWPRLQALSDGFRREGITSSIDSPAARLVQERIELLTQKRQEEALAAGQPVSSELPFEVMLQYYPVLADVFNLHDPDTQIVLERSSLNPYDRQSIKPFIDAEQWEAEVLEEHQDVVYVNVDDWPLYEAAVNNGRYIFLLHLGKEERFVLPGQSNFTNRDDMADLLAELGLEDREEAEAKEGGAENKV